MEYIELGDRIRVARRRRGYTQRELASVIGCSPSAVAFWENNRCSITKPMKDKIRSVLPEVFTGEELFDFGNTTEPVILPYLEDAHSFGEISGKGLRELVPPAVIAEIERDIYKKAYEDLLSVLRGWKSKDVSEP